MAELLSKDMLVDLAINLLNIVILFLITKALLYKPVKKYLDARKEKLEQEKAEAAAAQQAAEEVRQTYEAKLSDADAAAAALIAEKRGEAQKTAGEIVSAAEADAARIREKAQLDAAAAREEALESAKAEIMESAIGISEKILRREVTDRDDRRLVEDFFSAVAGDGQDGQ